jgi:hypothetical protein
MGSRAIVDPGPNAHCVMAGGPANRLEERDLAVHINRDTTTPDIPGTHRGLRNQSRTRAEPVNSLQTMLDDSTTKA